MTNKIIIALITAGLVSMAVLVDPCLVDASARNRQKKLDKSALSQWQRDRAELQRDRADLLRLYRSGASRGEIERKRAEIRDDLRKIEMGRGSIFSDFGNHQYGGYPYDTGYRGRWNRYDSGWWNYRNDRWDRRVWDYRHD
jgi:hypothetical protein